MASVQDRLKLKRESVDTWSTREQLCLASSVLKSGDQNWISVSRSLRPFAEKEALRPPDWFSQKSCAIQYAILLENADTPKRKKRESGETTGESIVRRLTQERIAELQQILAFQRDEYRQLKNEVNQLKSGSVSDEKLQKMWQTIEQEEREAEQKARTHAAWLAKRQQKNEPQNAQGASPTPRKALETPAEAPELQELQPETEEERKNRGGRSPLLTSLLKSPSPTTQIQNPPSTAQTTSPTIASLLGATTKTPSPQISTAASPQIHHLVTSTLAPSMPERPSAGAPTLSMLLELPSNLARSGLANIQGNQGTVTDSSRKMSNHVASPAGAGGVPVTESMVQIIDHIDDVIGKDKMPEVIDKDEINEIIGDIEELIKEEITKSPKTVEGTGIIEPIVAPPVEQKVRDVDETASSNSPHSEMAIEEIDQSTSNIAEIIGTAIEAEPKVIVEAVHPEVPAAEEKSEEPTPATTDEKKEPEPKEEEEKTETEEKEAEIKTEEDVVEEKSEPEEPAEASEPEVKSPEAEAEPDEGKPEEEKMEEEPVEKEEAEPTPEDKVEDVKTPEAVEEKEETKEEAEEKSEEKTEATEDVEEVPDEKDKNVEDDKDASAPVEDSPQENEKPEPTEEKQAEEEKSPETTETKDEPVKESESKPATPEGERSKSPDEDEEPEDPKDEKPKEEATSPKNDADEELEPPVLPNELEEPVDKPEDPQETKPEADAEPDTEPKPEVKEIKEEPVEEKMEESKSEDKEPKLEKEEAKKDEDIKKEEAPASATNDTEVEEEESSLTKLPARAMKTYSKKQNTAVDSEPETETDNPDHRAWKKSILLHYSRLATHKYASLFLRPITEDHAPGYHSVVFRPMDLSTIKKNIENGTIRTNTQFQRDVMLMFQNAIMYNKSDSFVYKMAVSMQEECLQSMQILVEATGEGAYRRETRTAASSSSETSESSIVKRKRSLVTPSPLDTDSPRLKKRRKSEND